MIKGTQHTNPATKMIIIAMRMLNIKRHLATHATTLIRRINTKPRIKQSWIFAVVIFAMFPVNGWRAWTWSPMMVATATGIIFVRFSGKLLHSMRLSYPKQNCFVPSEQFLGIISLIVLMSGMAVVILRSLWTLLTARESAVSTTSAALCAWLWRGWRTSFRAVERSISKGLVGRSIPVKLNCSWGIISQ